VHVGKLELGSLPLRDAQTHIAIEHAVVDAAPITATLPHGTLRGSARIDATHDRVQAQLDLRAADTELASLLPSHQGASPIDGSAQARLHLAGEGRSLHELASTADGRLVAVLPHGSLRTALAEATGLDLTRALGGLLKGKHDEVGVRCGLLSLEAQRGQLTVQNLVLDTEPVIVTGSGRIDLDSETLDLSLHGRPKHPRLVRLRSPVRVRGTLSHPSIAIDPAPVAVQAGASVALGVLLTPLASLLAFVDPGLAKSADCSALMAQGKAAGVPAAPVERSRAASPAPGG
jgi:uncharacterized protein involved in outer membrane biogenesis